MRIFDEEEQYFLVNTPTIIAIDIETTGFSPNKGAEILEIAAVKINLKKGTVSKKFHSFAKPRTGKVPAKTTELTSITYDMVKDAPNIEPVLRDFACFIKDTPLIFHNAGFDWERFLCPLMEKQGIFKNNAVLDTLSLAKACLPELGKYKLKDLCAHYGYSSENFHRAMDDTMATAALAVKFRELLIDEAPELLRTGYFGSSKQSKSQSLPNLRIKQIACWSKAKHKRIYISSTWGNIYYDLNCREWFVKQANIDQDVDFDTFEKEFIKAAKIGSIKQADQYFEKNVAVN